MLKLCRNVILAFAFAPVLSFAQTASAPTPPTTHILAIGHVLSPLTPDQRKTVLPQEVKDTLSLILAGKIDQSWFRKDGQGPIFLLNVTSVEEAHALLEKLPLGQAKLMEFDLIPVGPLAPLRLLLSDKANQ